jgi:hypothetical protein
MEVKSEKNAVRKRKRSERVANKGEKVMEKE